MRVLVLGAAGMLGREVCCELYKHKHLVHMPIRNSLDITDQQQVHKMIDTLSPEIVINCAGLVKSRIEPESDFYYVNGLAPHFIAYECYKVGARMIHISTDCVFNDELPFGRVWYETSKVSPNDVYSLSKLIGEVDYGPHLTIRTSFIGFGERGLLNWLLSSYNKIPGYVDSYWNGLTAQYVAKNIQILMQLRDVCGIFHLCSEDMVSKYKLLTLLRDILKLDIYIDETKAPVQHAYNRCLGTIHENLYKYLERPPLETMLHDLAEDYIFLRNKR